MIAVIGCALAALALVVVLPMPWSLVAWPLLVVGWWLVLRPDQLPGRHRPR